jgi:hypothetical protein
MSFTVAEFVSQDASRKGFPKRRTGFFMSFMLKALGVVAIGRWQDAESRGTFSLHTPLTKYD